MQRRKQFSRNLDTASAPPPTCPRLFWASFKLSAFTFGGGYVIVPLMERQFVEKYRWLEQGEIRNHIAIAQSAPGALAVNAALMAGYSLKGLAGAVSCLAGTVLPPFLIILCVYFLYAQFAANEWVRIALTGMGIGAIAVLIDAVIGLVIGIIREKNLFSGAVLVLAFTGMFAFGVPVWAVLLASIVAGVGWSLLRASKMKN
ncbi:MAG: chromate transporter [Oscillospiraceae bacterium]|nr:chromate transporter [Oscillospiraceae bacterium]